MNDDVAADVALIRVLLSYRAEVVALPEASETMPLVELADKCTCHCLILPDIVVVGRSRSAQIRVGHTAPMCVLLSHHSWHTAKVSHMRNHTERMYNMPVHVHVHMHAYCSRMRCAYPA